MVSDVSKTRPSPGHRDVDPYARNKLQPGIPPPTTDSTREAVCLSSGKTQARGTYLEYTQNIVLQHQGVNPTDKPDTS
ncbi:hypothetical protein TNCV_3772401 [Trichonephila clavipes]|nr:hypothetical protein TNCV_3772401 [Trichonephila clavipes]